MKRFVIPSLLLLLAAVPARAQTRAGGEFQVNTYTPGFQSYPAVALLPSGAFVVVWEDGDQTDDVLGGIKARRFDPAGAPLGAAFVVNTITAGPQYQPSVYSDPRGGFIAAWSTPSASGGLSVAAQRFDPAGRRVGGEFLVSTYTLDFLTVPVMAFDQAGNFVVVWVAQAQDGSFNGIYAQRFDASGARLGGEFRVNTYTTGEQHTPTVIRDPSGGFVIAWESSGQEGFTELSVGQRFDTSGNRVGAEFHLGEGTIQYRPTLVRTADGGFVASWMGADGNGDGVFARRFGPSGTPLGPEFIVNQQTINQQFWPGLTADATGNFTVAWTSYLPAADGFDMRAARFEAGGQRRGNDFLVNTYTQGDQYVNRYAPTLASDPAGNFVVVWSSVGQDGSSYGVFAQRYGGLMPVGASVDAGVGLNGVLEPGETVDVQPSWRNVNGAAQTFTGTLTQLTGPAGAVYTIADGSATYGTVANGASAPCTDCYRVGVNDPATRPATHWDATAVERLAPDTQGQVKRWALHVGRSFTDVPAANPFYRFVEILLHNGITGGCTATTFCPQAATTREQMAAFVLAAREGASYLPAACSASLYTDVPVSSPFCRWIQELTARGVAGGCAPQRFCPGDPVTREQMSVFLLRTLDPTLNPPACSPPNTFADVPETSAFCRWVEELARRGITGGCGGGNFCPSAAVTREQMGVFLASTFGLVLYGP